MDNMFGTVYYTHNILCEDDFTSACGEMLRGGRNEKYTCEFESDAMLKPLPNEIERIYDSIIKD